METQPNPAPVPFMLLFRNSGPENHRGLSSEERQQLVSRWNDWFDTLVTQGKAVEGQPLELETRVVSGAGGARIIDGPFPEAKEAIAGYVFRFDGVHRTTGPNWHADQGVVTVLRDGRTVAVMHPQKRTYAGDQVQTESAVDAGVFRDLYVALGEPMDTSDIGGAWALRLYYKPFVRWIWGGGVLMMLGGFVCAGDRRFRIKRIAAEAAAPAAATSPQESPA